MEPGSRVCLPVTSSISRGLFENSLQTAVRVSTTAILFLEERTTCDLTLPKGSWVFFPFFLKDQEAENGVSICLVQAQKRCELPSEPPLQTFVILIQHIKAELLSDSTSEGPFGLHCTPALYQSTNMESFGLTQNHTKTVRI